MQLHHVLTALTALLTALLAGYFQFALLDHLHVQWRELLHGICRSGSKRMK